MGSDTPRRRPGGAGSYRLENLPAGFEAVHAAKVSRLLRAGGLRSRSRRGKEGMVVGQSDPHVTKVTFDFDIAYVREQRADDAHMVLASAGYTVTERKSADHLSFIVTRPTPESLPAADRVYEVTLSAHVLAYVEGTDVWAAVNSGRTSDFRAEQVSATRKIFGAPVRADGSARVWFTVAELGNVLFLANELLMVSSDGGSPGELASARRLVATVIDLLRTKGKQ
jgi:hypothetical protein